MSRYGPVPQHSEDLARDRSRKGGEVTPITPGVLRPVEIPAPNREWHPIALMLWESLALSGQSDFYQQSDWAFAYSLCDDLDHYKRPFTAKDGTEYHKRSGQMLQTIYSAMSSLLVTEADRRRVHIELAAPEDESENASVTAIADYQAGLGLVPPLPESDDNEDDD